MEDLPMPKEVKIVVRAVRRKEPDLRKLARALIEMARREAAAEAPAESSSDANAQEQAS
jgi:hypothetical protein